MIEDVERPSELVRAWETHARAALDWREGEPIAPVLEALALSVALEVVGALGDVPRGAREELVRLGRRALLHAAQPPTAAESDDPDDEEDALEAHRIALVLARDGLRALSGRPVEGEEAPGRTRRPSARELARLLSGRAEPYEAATIARAVRASAEARAELVWALRTRAAESAPPVVRMLAAADGEPMRDPASGRRAAVVSHPDSGAPLVEVYVFPGARLAAYGADDAPLRVEAEGVRTEAMQPGYWAGALDPSAGEAAGERELAIYVGEARYEVTVSLS